MNVIRITGRLGKLKPRTQADGAPTLSSWLEFHEGQGAVQLLTIGSRRCESFSRYREGDYVEVTGTLVINRESFKAAILVSNIVGTRPTSGDADALELQMHVAEKHHRLSAKVPGR